MERQLSIADSQFVLNLSGALDRVHVSAGLMLALNSAIAAIVEHVAYNCQIVQAQCFSCSGEPEGVKKHHAL